jgi:hypothetical protein
MIGHPFYYSYMMSLSILVLFKLTFTFTLRLSHNYKRCLIVGTDVIKYIQLFLIKSILYNEILKS